MRCCSPQTDRSRLNTGIVALPAESRSATHLSIPGGTGCSASELYVEARKNELTSMARLQSNCYRKPLSFEVVSVVRASRLPVVLPRHDSGAYPELDDRI